MRKPSTLSELTELEILQRDTGLTGNALHVEWNKRFEETPEAKQVTEHKLLSLPFGTIEYVTTTDKWKATSRYTGETFDGFSGFNGASYWLKLIADRAENEARRRVMTTEEVADNPQFSSIVSR